MSRRRIIRRSTREDEPVLPGPSSDNQYSEGIEARPVTTIPANGGGDDNSSSGVMTNQTNLENRTEGVSTLPTAVYNVQPMDDGDPGGSQGRGTPIPMRQTSFPPVAESINYERRPEPAPWLYPEHVLHPSQRNRPTSSAPVTPYAYNPPFDQPRSSQTPGQYSLSANFQSASAPVTPYNYGLASAQGHQVYASPLPMSNYIPSPAPRTWGTFGQYVGPSSNTYPAFSYAAPAPPNTPHDPSPSIYGGGAQETPGERVDYQRHRQSSRSQGYHVPHISQPASSQIAPYGIPFQRQAEAFVANDPWRPQTQGKRQKDAETFDEIPLPQSHINPYLSYPSQQTYPSMPIGNSGAMTGHDIPVLQPGGMPPVPVIIQSSTIRSSSKPSSHHSAVTEDAGSSYSEDEGSSYSEDASMYTDSPRPPPSPPRNQTPTTSQSKISSASIPSSSITSQSSPPLQTRKKTFLGGVIGVVKRVISPAGRFGHETEKPDFPELMPAFKPPSHIPYIPTVPNNFQQPYYYRQPIVYFPDPSQKFGQLAFQFVFATLPRQIYLNILLRLPSLYWSRVARIFEEADLTLPELKKMALETASQARGEFDLRVFESNKVPQYDQLKSTWESFIDSVMREWKTFNIISVLLLSAILTILQIESAADDPVTRYSALFSLICALVSLLFGCVYIIRFGSMRKTYKAAEWALEAKKTKTVIWWNVWVMLAMPAIWLAWSIILYIACIMSYIWRTSPQNSNPPTPLSEEALLIIRVVISSILGLGLLYGVLVLITFRRYGEAMDRAWKRRIDGWVLEKLAGPYASAPIYNSRQPYIPSPYYPMYPSSPPPHDYVPHYGTEYYQHPSRDVESNYPAYPDFGPTYATADYVPPPEPYDSPVHRSPESIKSTELGWRSTGGTGSRQNSADTYSAPEVVTEWASQSSPASLSSLPAPPPQALQKETSVRQTQIPRRTTLAVPPPPHLPPIPGTPKSVSATSNASKISSPGDSFGGYRESQAQADEFLSQETSSMTYAPLNSPFSVSHPESESPSILEDQTPVHTPTLPQDSSPDIEIGDASQKNLPSSSAQDSS